MQVLAEDTLQNPVSLLNFEVDYGSVTCCREIKETTIDSFRFVLVIIFFSRTTRISILGKRLIPVMGYTLYKKLGQKAY